MENVFSSVKPFYRLAKTLGLFPFSFVGSELKGILELNWQGVLASLTWLSLSIFLIALRFLHEDGIISSAMLTKLLHAQAIFGILMLIVQFFYQLLKLSSMKQFLLFLNEIDNEVKSELTV